MAHKRKNFPESVKAAIFKRDRGTCCFTGKSVWVFDYGASPLWDTDWPDHKRPSARGGTRAIDNGVCASSWANGKKGSNTRDSAYLLREGKPTQYYLSALGPIPPHLVSQLQRLAGLHESDWYLARAAKDVLIAVRQSLWPAREKRTPTFWCRSALKRVQKWERRATNVPSMEERKVLLTPLDRDQKLLVGLRECESLADVQRIVRDLMPWYKANNRAYDALLRALTDGDRKKVARALAAAGKDPFVSPRFLTLLRDHGKSLSATGFASA